MSRSRREPALTLSLDVLPQCPLPDPNQSSDKNSRGRALIIAGSVAVPGTAMLAGVAALRAGAGKIQLGVPRTIATALGTAFPSAGFYPSMKPKSVNPSPRPPAGFQVRWN